MISEHSISLPSLQRLRYLKAGSGGPAVICLAGFGVTSDLYRRNLPALAAAGFTAYAIDRPGFGGSSGPRGWGLEYSTRLMNDLFVTLELEQAAWIGNSTGGAEALQIYLAHPRRVTALVMVDPFGVGVHYPPHTLFPRTGPHSIFLGTWGRGERAYRRVAELMFSNPDEVIPDLFRVGKGWFYRLRTPNRVISLAGTAASLGLPFQRKHWLERLSARFQNDPVPLLTVWGEQDPLLPVKHAREFQARMPGSQLVIYPGVRHHPPAEVPGPFNQLVIDFLSKQVL